MATLGRAIAIAAEAHSGQFDKAGAPYILHPLRVMLSLSTEEERIVGVLHDLVEDCEEWTFERLSHNHPDAVEASQAVALSIFLARQGISKNEIAGIIPGLPREYRPPDPEAWDPHECDWWAPDRIL